MGQQRFTVVQVKTEATPGTDAVPVAADSLLLKGNSVTPNTETYRRPVNDSLARPMRAGIAVPQTLGFEYMQEMRGSGDGAFGVGLC